ncbi:MAG TPA: nucleotide exchange factor GrpE [Anaerolineales bacterium]|nr:nucleotide exchange factor GrpE [Anaerolineales bacterium]HMR99203.1 nucleotide exchange factor GrpE [Anaerolineales bacterium]HNQ96033.1 nucleotide exchange factor GrpE [Anaerolineales bacterium]HNS61043.1 nucleotide exchange factor GrpE [Anaerolineales bacterium]
MTNKKNHKNETHEIKIEAADQPEAENQPQVDVDALQRQLEDAENKLAESVEGWQRAQADFQNYRKRVERDNELMYVSMKSDIVKKMLPVLDDLERALQNRPADDAWASGIELIARKLQNILDVEGVKRIEAKGLEFDPKFHEAISHEPNDEVESHHVIEVVQNGYMLGERVIRPALVRVAQ